MSFTDEQVARARLRAVIEYDRVHVACGGVLEPDDLVVDGEPRCYDCGPVHPDETVEEDDLDHEVMGESLAWAIDQLDQSRKERDEARKLAQSACRLVSLIDDEETRATHMGAVLTNSWGTDIDNAIDSMPDNWRELVESWREEPVS